MLYRIESNGRLTWTPQFSEKHFEMFNEHDVNLDRLDWEPVMESHDLASVVQVALRHGYKTPSGLAISGQRVSALERPAALRLVYGDLQRAEQHPEIIQADNKMEQVMPGWIKNGERNKDEVHQATDNSIREAEAEAKAELQGPVDDELMAWWQSLGGLS